MPSTLSDRPNISHSVCANNLFYFILFGREHGRELLKMLMCFKMHRSFNVSEINVLHNMFRKHFLVLFVGKTKNGNALCFFFERERKRVHLQP